MDTRHNAPASAIPAIDLNQLRRVLRHRGWRVPFTVSLLAIMVISNWAEGSLTHSVASNGLLEHVGFGVPSLRDGQFDTLLTSIPFALYPWMLATIAFLVLIGVAPFEILAGWKRTAIVFFVSQTGGYLLAALLVSWPLATLGVNWGQHLANARDVGPSAGAFGCLAALVWFLPERWRSLGGGALFAYLLGFLLLTHRVWDVEHLIGGLLGLGAGWLLIERRELIAGAFDALRTLPRPDARDIVAALVALAGLMNIVSALVTTASSRVASWDTDVPFAILHGTRTYVTLSGFALILLGRSLSQGRRVGWVATITLLAGSVISHVVKGLDIEEASVELLLIVALVVRHNDYQARPDVVSVTRALRLSAVALAALPVYIAAGFWLMRDDFDRPLRTGLAARESLARLLFTTTHQLDGASFEANWFLDSMTWIWAATLLFCSVALLRPVLRPTIETSSDRRDAIDLLHHYGGSPIGQMTTWPGNTLLLNHHRNAYLAYRLIGNVALVLGDPIGAPEGRSAGIQEFVQLCHRNGWTPCFYGVGRSNLDAYSRAGLSSIQVGEDAYIDLSDFHLHGRQWQDARTAINKARKMGIEFHLADLGGVDDGTLRQLHEISDSWLHSRRLPEMGFTLGSLTAKPDPEAKVATAIDQRGHVHAFVTWLPIYGTCGWVIDIMRRRPDAFNGVIEFLIVESALAFRTEGAAVVSLSTAPLARVARDGDAADTFEQAITRLVGLIEPFYQTRTLFEFKRKFSPRWEPVYIAFPGATCLPRIGYAILRAYLPTLSIEDIRDLLAPARAGRPKPREGVPDHQSDTESTTA
ncbi:MAG TPA: phosphatidylglycerol lysyltransferase domain-containing protein [Thermomicrobiales bacterium]|nr:phosphatidylglycerol lysyltransferase domain-containing protein [Thermomicrobiales bacterium]